MNLCVKPSILDRPMHRQLHQKLHHAGIVHQFWSITLPEALESFYNLPITRQEPVVLMHTSHARFSTISRRLFFASLPTEFLEKSVHVSRRSVATSTSNFRRAFLEIVPPNFSISKSTDETVQWNDDYRGSSIVELFDVRIVWNSSEKENISQEKRCSLLHDINMCTNDVSFKNDILTISSALQFFVIHLHLELEIVVNHRSITCKNVCKTRCIIETFCQNSQNYNN